MIKTICFGVQTPQIRLELKVKMKGLETQVIGAGAKSHTSEESSVSGARGHAREGRLGSGKRVKSEMTRWSGFRPRDLTCHSCCYSSIFTAAMGSQRGINS